MEVGRRKGSHSLEKNGGIGLAISLDVECSLKTHMLKGLLPRVTQLRADGNFMNLLEVLRSFNGMITDTVLQTCCCKYLSSSPLNLSDFWFLM